MIDEGQLLVAPPLFSIEMVSGIRKSVYRGTISEADGNWAFEQVGNLAIEIRAPQNLLDEAWTFAKKFNRPAIYDSCYLALASILGCDLWTADQRLVNAVTPSLSWVRTLI